MGNYFLDIQQRETLRGVSESTTNQGKENLCIYVSQVTITIITHKSAHWQELGIAPRGNNRVVDPGGVEPDLEPSPKKKNRIRLSRTSIRIRSNRIYP